MEPKYDAQDSERQMADNDDWALRHGVTTQAASCKPGFAIYWPNVLGKCWNQRSLLIETFAGRRAEYTAHALHEVASPQL